MSRRMLSGSVGLVLDPRLAVIALALAAVGWAAAPREGAPVEAGFFTDREALLRVHPAGYLEALEAIGAAGGAALDPDTVMGPRTWEAALAGSHWKLDNLIAIIDVNNQQADGPSTEMLGF